MNIINPRPFIASLVGRDVRVVLKWGVEYRGKLKAADAYMNLQLENVIEDIEGNSFGIMDQLLIRCNNLLYLHKHIPESKKDTGSEFEEATSNKKEISVQSSAEEEISSPFIKLFFNGRILSDDTSFCLAFYCAVFHKYDTLSNM
ncbi:probable small nuclear ribonucleoprotein F [Caerostris extrusa]|uniref:Sm protein F n=1 Tax=Caerostris extrusa TaxID=172846 RepID=A0AAV4PH21_CAEEX|nr:probable small nuclear ribonucleoprotein F [Caerostris extrusa]